MAENRNRTNQNSGRSTTGTTRRSTGASTSRASIGTQTGRSGMNSRNRVSEESESMGAMGSTGGYGIESMEDREDVSTNRLSSGSSRRSRSVSENDLAQRLQALGVNEQMIDTAKSFIINAVEGKLRSLDIEESLSSAGKAATRSVRKMHGNRPALFYAGIATLAAGVGLLIGSAIEKEYEYELTYIPEE